MKRLRRTPSAVVLLTCLVLGTPGAGQTCLFEESKLFPLDGGPLDHFGGAVAISGQTVLVGAPGDDDAGPDDGAVYVYDLGGGAPVKLLPGPFSASFGTAVDVDGATAVIGTAHTAYVFDLDTNQELFELDPLDGFFGDDFGRAVALDGGVAIVGARHDDDNGANSGSAAGRCAPRRRCDAPGSRTRSAARRRPSTAQGPSRSTSTRGRRAASTRPWSRASRSTRSTGGATRRIPTGPESC